MFDPVTKFLTLSQMPWIGIVGRHSFSYYKEQLGQLIEFMEYKVEARGFNIELPYSSYV